MFTAHIQALSKGFLKNLHSVSFCNIHTILTKKKIQNQTKHVQILKKTLFQLFIQSLHIKKNQNNFLQKSKQKPLLKNYIQTFQLYDLSPLSQTPIQDIFQTNFSFKIFSPLTKPNKQYFSKMRNFHKISKPNMAIAFP